MNTKITGTESPLVEARKESLKQFQSFALSAHGKLWDMDLFSWCNPEIELLANTMHSFPFHVIWVGNQSDIVKMLEIEPHLVSNLHTVISYDYPVELMVLHDFNIPTYQFANLTQALTHLFNVKDAKTVCLFTASSLNWLKNKALFDNFLSLVQRS